MVADRASDLDAITLDMYYTKSKHHLAIVLSRLNQIVLTSLRSFFPFEYVVLSRRVRIYVLHFIEKSASDANHPNAQKSSVIASVANEQSQAMLKKQQPESQEPFTNGKSPARTSREDNGVEQNPTAMITDELSSVTDDVTNVCKVIMRKPNRCFTHPSLEHREDPSVVRESTLSRSISDLAVYRVLWKWSRWVYLGCAATCRARCLLAIERVQTWATVALGNGSQKF